MSRLFRRGANLILNNGCEIFDDVRARDGSFVIASRLLISCAKCNVSFNAVHNRKRSNCIFTRDGNSFVGEVIER